MHAKRPPRSENELLARANGLAGLRIGALAKDLGQDIPADPVRAKGFIGELIEVALHASAGSRPVPDFEHLGIELKTIPVSRAGEPRESTHVCAVPLLDNIAINWETSLVRRKLQRVLWIPYLAESELSLAERVIGNALLWTPSPDQERVLKGDFEELMDKVCLG
jgi:DNA mismatch repair protein MutH